MFEITCSIVLYNNPYEDVKKAVESFLNCNKSIKLYLVDNSPEDTLRYKFIAPNLEYIFTGKNLGYGAGHNIAISRLRGKSRYHIILNPDIEFDPSTIGRLMDFMDSNASIGLVMPKVLYRNGDTQYLCKRLPSPVDLIFRRFIPGPAKIFFKNWLASYELRHRDYNGIMEVPNLSGCFMFLRSAALEKVGLFDERYFLYLEDTDLCRRIHEYYNTVYYPEEKIIHGYQKGSYKKLGLLKHHMVSSILYFNKWGWFRDKRRQFINKALSSAPLAKTSFFTPEIKLSA